MRSFRKWFFIAFTMHFSLFLFCSAMLYFPGSIPDANAAPSIPPWDFQDHTINHADLTTLSSSQIKDQLTSVDAAFQAHKLPLPKHIAYPNGAYNTQVIDTVSAYRLSGRLAKSNGLSSEVYPIPNWYTLHTVSLVPSTTVDKVKTLIDDVIQKNGLMNLFTHSVLDPPDGNGCTPTTLSQILDYLVTKQNAGKLSVLTMSQAYTQYNGQKAVVVVSFDDSWYTDYTVVWPMFKVRGLAGTSYITINNVNSNSPTRLNWAQVSEMAQINQAANLGWSIKISSAPSNSGTTNPSGSINGLNRELTITATPNPGYIFTHWLFNGNTLTSNPVNLPTQPAGTNHVLTAHFAPAQSPTPNPTLTPTPTTAPPQTPTSNPTPTLPPTIPPTPTETLSPTTTPTPYPANTPTSTPDVTSSSFPVPTSSPYPIPTASSNPQPTPTQKPTIFPQHTASPLPTTTYSPTPKATTSPSPSTSSIAEPSSTPSITATLNQTTSPHLAATGSNNQNPSNIEVKSVATETPNLPSLGVILATVIISVGVIAILAAVFLANKR